jgi:PAS domain S-box-containing protein
MMENALNHTLRILIIEDSEDDAQLIIRALKKVGYHPIYQRIETAATLEKALQQQEWDIILCDYNLPTLNALTAIKIIQNANIETPIIIVSGAIGEDAAIECMRLGAQDYIMKTNLSRLGPAIERELAESRLRKKQKQAEEELSAWIQRYELIVASSGQVAYEYIVPTGRISWGSSIQRVLGYTPEEISGGFAQWESLLHPQDKEATMARLKEAEEACGYWDAQYRLLHKNGKYIWIRDRGFFVPDEKGKAYKQLGMLEDITEYKETAKQKEDALRKLQDTENRYKALFERSLDMVFLIDFSGRFIDANDAGLKRFGYSREEIKRLHLSSLLVDDELPSAFDTIEEIKATGSQRKPKEFKLRQKNGDIIYIETQGSAILSDGKSIGIQAIARDITERKQAEEKLRQTLDRLKEAVNATIAVLVSAVETRDPYTAGHQIRVAHLACAIAAEMSLPPEKIDGLRLAGSIHDIGKLAVPTEILSKPTKLTDIEFSLIKEHPQRGYEMIRHVESLWPLAEIVYQHHERMNGSGYPRHLKGEQIILEARIMAVADVVEAMASHRPYRPGLGVDVALQEIEKNKGVLYDKDVAEACLKLFREKNYSFPRG